MKRFDSVFRGRWPLRRHRGAHRQPPRPPWAPNTGFLRGQSRAIHLPQSAGPPGPSLLLRPQRQLHRRNQRSPICFSPGGRKELFDAPFSPIHTAGCSTFPSSTGSSHSMVATPAVTFRKNPSQVGFSGRRHYRITERFLCASLFPHR